MASRIPVEIPIKPWFSHHSFNGQTVFPAVETMLLLASYAKEQHSLAKPCTMVDASFAKFLAIEEGQTAITALIEAETEGTGAAERLCLKLLTKRQFKKMSRIQEHARVAFPLYPQQPSPPVVAPLAKDTVTINSHRIYQELVPFGPMYRSLTGELHLTANHAWGTLLAPDPGPQPMENHLGSPFPLDGAMHAACVLGQCLADFVPFPVAFNSRHVLYPTRAGEYYQCTVNARSLSRDALLVDLVIMDTKGKLYEIVTGLQMRDVTAGAIKPAPDLPRLAFSPH